MLNKINLTSPNISFKRGYTTQATQNLPEESQNKIQLGIDLVNYYFQRNDVFFNPDENGNVEVFVQKSNPNHILLNEDIFNELDIDLSPKELADTINLSSSVQFVHDRLWNKPPQIHKEKITDFKKITENEFLNKVYKIIDKFNDRFPDLLN